MTATTTMICARVDFRAMILLHAYKIKTSLSDTSGTRQAKAKALKETEDASSSDDEANETTEDAVDETDDTDEIYVPGYPARWMTDLDLSDDITPLHVRREDDYCINWSNTTEHSPPCRCRSTSQTCRRRKSCWRSAYKFEACI